ncbi:MAG TPA: transketolase, partial [Bacteroidetes bacterium]|nr:transketolase [Bacteroidota bacterium]
MYSSEVSPGITISSARLQRFANTVRGLAIDAVQNANSGHPGLPMGAADVAAVLWSKFLKFNPADPNWADRDRFVLSGGHGSMLLYALLHLTGFDLSLDDLKSFRQLNSKTPGHPEYGHTPGVEITTGPLGQGLASAVGMAIAERRLAEKYNRPGFTLIDHYTYVLAGDGDLMEGISHEACSLAGHLGLNKLIVLYDDNDISIDGSTALTFSESVPARFAAYGWNILKIDGHNMQEIESALAAARKSAKKPTLICCKTVIGYGSPNRAGTAKAHGEPLGPEEARLSKRRLGIPEYWPFHVPADVAEIAAECRTNGAMLQSKWEAL